MPDADTNKARAALWLKSEEALGLTAVSFPRRKLAGKAASRPEAAPGRTNPTVPRLAAAPAARPPVRSAPGPVAPPHVAPPRPSSAPAALPLAPAGASARPAALDVVTPFSSPVLSTDEKRQRLQQINEEQVKLCKKCRLCQQRTTTVFGEGNPDARLLFIGEGPGETEDLTGRPFVGKAGDLLTKMIGAMGLQREQVFIANIVKCRPPGNRQPAGDEVEACTPYLLAQIETIRPQVIVTLGLPATRFMLNSQDSMGRLRGKWYDWRGIRLMPTYHPSYVIRSYTPEVRATVWGDLKLVMAELGLKQPRGGKSL